MIFIAPVFLFLLLLLFLVLWLGWPSRGPSRGREILSLALRLLIAALLILALAGLEVRRAGNQLSVVFLVDNSDSLPPAARQAALAYVRAALQEMGPDDRAGVILFGSQALVERPLSANRNLDGFTSKVTSLQTDIAGAIRLGLALLPADTARRMVILSDGVQTAGDAFEAARLAAAGQVQIVVVPFQAQGGAETLVTAVNAPAHLRAGEQFGLEINIESSSDQQVGVRVLAGAAVAYQGALQLRRGANLFTLPLTAGTPGFAAYRVQIIPLADSFYQNNELAAFSQVAGPPKVLVVKNAAPRDGVDESRELIAALAASDILADVVPASGLPSELAVLSEYASVILVDVPARDLAPRQMEALRTYVRDLGGGLVAVGGPSAFGVGGYFKTPLEEVLPVEMQIKDQMRRPRLTILFIIDKSGSMSETSGGATKVDLAKEAAVRSLELLSPTDKIGVIAFDDSAKWVVNITPLDNPDAVRDAIGTIRADGGTDILAGVQAASAQLPQDDSTVKHIILLTDGGADPTGIAELVRSMNQNFGITLSTVGVGRDAAPFLPQLAEAGGGLYHFAADPASIPTIFTEETSLATRAYIIEGEFLPRQTNPSPILAGIAGTPALLGYIGTTAKDAAQTILVSNQDDPLLAAWQYGLGKSVAWTSDATGRWAKNWVSWEDFARFWAQTARYTITAGAGSSVGVEVNYSAGEAAISVDARSDAGAYLNGLTMQVNVVDPGGKTQTVTLQQTAPGKYEGSFTPTTEGAYLVRVAGSEAGQNAAAQPAVAETAGWVLSYSPEYRTFSADPNFLLRLAQTTGGSVAGDDLADLFRHDLPAPRAATQPLWPLLLTLAACLLPLDIAVRRLVVTRYDLQRGLERVRAWARLAAPRPDAVPPERAQQLSALRRAKDRASAPAAKPGENIPPPIVTQPPAADRGERPPAAKPAAPGATSSTLLARKREREKKQ